MAYNLVALPNGWAVDQAIVSEEERVVIIRFGQETTPECMLMDKTLASVVTKLQNMAVIYTVDIEEIKDFNKMYELYDPVCIMFFYRNKHIMVDVGTGNNNKINWPLTNKQELIDLAEVVWIGARKGKGLVISPKDYSSKNKSS